MAVYTVFEPPPSGDAMRDAERTAFVREGFSWLALLFPLLWLLWHRMWLVLVLWIAVAVLTQLGASLIGEPAPLIAGLTLSLLTGFEANGLRRWTLARRGFDFAGVVAGTNRDECERRFFAGWQPARPPAPEPASARPWTPHHDEGAESRHVVGLFPTAERS